MSRDYKLYLRDILTAIQRIERHLQGIDEATFKKGTLAVDGVLFNLITIGEAAKNLLSLEAASSSAIEWREIARFRDFVVHHYFNVSLDKVWDIVQHDLPELRQQIEQLSGQLENTDD